MDYSGVTLKIQGKKQFLLLVISHFAVVSQPHHWIVTITQQFLQPVLNISEAPTNQFWVKTPLPFLELFAIYEAAPG